MLCRPGRLTMLGGSAPHPTGCACVALEESSSGCADLAPLTALVLPAHWMLGCRGALRWISQRMRYPAGPSPAIYRRANAGTALGNWEVYADTLRHSL